MSALLSYNLIQTFSLNHSLIVDVIEWPTMFHQTPQNYLGWISKHVFQLIPFPISPIQRFWSWIISPRIFLGNSNNFTYLLQRFSSIQELTLVLFFSTDNVHDTYVSSSNI